MASPATVTRAERIAAVWSGSLIIYVRDQAGTLYDVTGHSEETPGVIIIDIEPLHTRGE